MTTATAPAPPETSDSLFHLIGGLEGGDPNDEGTDIARRFDDVVGRSVDGTWEPTELGEALAWAVMSIIVRTAPKEHGLRAYQACEDNDALDRVMADLRRSILREVRKVVAA